MGYIKVEVGGSFSPHRAESFGAQNYGHADAVARAIEFLSSEVLPAAIAQDHALHSEGHEPSVGWSGTGEER